MNPPRRTRILITAGPTYEPIDAVRFIGNRSSGRMGLALTAAAIEAGQRPTLLLGPSSLEVPGSSQAEVRRFQTCAELQALLQQTWPDHDVLIMAAAVADFRPRPSAEAKLRREGRGLTLELEATPDLVAEAAGARRPDQFVIGFALEPAGRLEVSAREKLLGKGLDAIVANPLETMESAEISATLITRDGQVAAPAGQSKEEFARWLIAWLDRQLAARAEKTERARETRP